MAARRMARGGWEPPPRSRQRGAGSPGTPGPEGPPAAAHQRRDPGQRVQWSLGLVVPR